MILGGADQLQQAKMSRQATLLGMQMGQLGGANAANQQAQYNAMMGNAQANQMNIQALKRFGWYRFC